MSNLQNHDVFETEWGVNIEIFMGDITKIDVDCIVNAANNFMLGGGGVDGAIHRAAGPKLLEECRKAPADPATNYRCSTGSAVLTKGPFSKNLHSTDVIHTVGPIMTPSSNMVEGSRLIANCITNSLVISQHESYRSIAFPAISCGIYNGIGPAWTDEAAQSTVSATLDFLRTCAANDQISTLPLKRIVFLFNVRDLYDTWREKLALSMQS